MAGEYFDVKFILYEAETERARRDDQGAKGEYHDC
jgi:hypothetical protein